MPDHPKGVQLCALWVNETKDGRKYYRGKLGDATIMGWVDTEKRSEKSPDLRLVLYPPPKRDEGAPPTERTAAKKAPAGESSGDDIPF